VAGAGSPSGRQLQVQPCQLAHFNPSELRQHQLRRRHLHQRQTSRDSFGTFFVIEITYAIPSLGTCLVKSSEAFLSRLATYEPTPPLPSCPEQSKYRWWVYDRWCERSRGKPGRLSDVELDVGRMQQAAELLLGRHDFSAFMDNKRPAGQCGPQRASGIRHPTTPPPNPMLPIRQWCGTTGRLP
jgi:hypothetical protein